MELDSLKAVVADVLKVDPNELTERTTFMGDLGADSLDVYQIVNELEDRLNITLEEEEIERISTIGEAVELIKKAERKQ
ncbi:MAG: acyl carrier protein [Lachnospiraceae bacterium]|nr:acyl carrier protein [Lachnospiraceae bacterium]